MSALDDLIAAKKANAAPASVETSTPEPPAAAPDTGSHSALASLIAKKSGAAPSAPEAPENPALHALKQTATGIGNALDVQRWAVAKLATGKSDTGEQRTAERNAVGTQGIYDAIGKIPVVGHALQGASDVVQDTLTDPLTYETLGAGPILKATGLAAKAAPMIGKLGDAYKGIRDTPLGATIYDFTHWGGKIEREQGASKVDELRGIANNSSSQGARVQQHLVRRFGEATKDLSDEDKVNVGRALNGEVDTSALTPRQQSTTRQLRTLTEMDYKMRADTARTIAFNAGTKGMSDADKAVLQRMFRQNKPLDIPEPGKRTTVPNPDDTVKQRSRDVNIDVPGGADENGVMHPAVADLPPVRAPYKRPLDNQAAIDRAKMLNQKFQDINFAVEQGVPKREHYMPWAHEYDETGKLKGREASEVAANEYHDPRTKTRDDLQFGSPDMLRSGFEAMAKNTGKQVQTGVINKTLGDLLDHPDIDALFKQTIKATGEYRTNPDKIKDAWLNVVGYPRAATVSLTPRHAANILDLAANTVPPERLPGYMKDVTDLTTKLMKAKDEREYAALTKEGRDLGALSGNFKEREAFFQQVPDTKIPGTQTPIFGPLAGKSTGALGAYTRMNNKLVWAIDEAAKQTYAKLLVERGEASGLEAGGMASKRLVDYEHKSPLVQAMKYIAPFGTFRGSIPGAVAGGVARNPGRAALLNRASGGMMYGGKPAKGQQEGATMYNPTADVSRGFSDLNGAAEYLRATLADPVKAGATVLGAEPLMGEGGASIRDLGTELADAPGEIAHGQFNRLGTPRKESKYADAVALRRARFLNYGNPEDWRAILSAAAAGVPEARDVLEQVNAGQFRPKQGSIPDRLLKESAMQVLGIGMR